MFLKITHVPGVLIRAQIPIPASHLQDISDQQSSQHSITGQGIFRSQHKIISFHFHISVVWILISLLVFEEAKVPLSYLEFVCKPEAEQFFFVCLVLLLAEPAGRKLLF